MTHTAIQFAYIQFDDSGWRRTVGPQIRYTATRNGAGLWMVWFDRSWCYHFSVMKKDQVLVSFQAPLRSFQLNTTSVNLAGSQAISFRDRLRVLLMRWTAPPPARESAIDVVLLKPP